MGMGDRWVPKGEKPALAQKQAHVPANMRRRR